MPLEQNPMYLTLTYLLTLGFAGLMYYLNNFAVSAIVAVTTTNDISFQFALWLWQPGIPLLILFGSTYWYLLRMSEGR